MFKLRNSPLSLLPRVCSFELELVTVPEPEVNSADGTFQVLEKRVQSLHGISFAPLGLPRLMLDNLLVIGFVMLSCDLVRLNFAGDFYEQVQILFYQLYGFLVL